MNDGNNLWFLKPTSCNRGRGVHVFDSIEKMMKLMQGISEGTIEKLVNNSESDEEEVNPKDP